MALDGIPISDEQCIGDSLPIINNSFQALDTNIFSLSSSVIFKPSSPSSGNVLTYNGSSWIASTPTTGGTVTNVTGVSPISVTNGSTTPSISLGIVPADKGGAGSINGILKANGSGTVSAAVASTDYVAPGTLNNYILKPSSATNGNVLTYNGSTWIAGSITFPTPNPNTFYTTVGNASAGIFASAVCFIPSNPGTGTWIVPPGCYTARVTVVGGGGGYSSGGRSHFNYPSGSTTGPNQLFADGGNQTYNHEGGNAGWNGVNDIAIGGGYIQYQYGKGGAGGASAGGYGGGGGGGAADIIGTGGGSFGGPGLPQTSGGGSGGISGGGGYGIGGPNYSDIRAPGHGGGTPTLSYVAINLPNFKTATNQPYGIYKVLPGFGGGGGGWCTAIVSVTPGQSYSYAVGAGGVAYSGSSPTPYGMVVIEW